MKRVLEIYSDQGELIWEYEEGKNGVTDIDISHERERVVVRGGGGYTTSVTMISGFKWVVKIIPEGRQG